MGVFENNLYCNFDAGSMKAVAGKDILLCIFNNDGTSLLAISGQQGLTINRGADSIEVDSKDTAGGWKSKIAGMKEWSIDNDGLFVANDQSHRALTKCYENGDPVCLKVVNVKKKQSLFGGLAYISDYSLEAPHDDAMTYSISLDGSGALVDLLEETGGNLLPETGKPHKYTQGELENMTKSAIAEIAIARGYTTVSEDETKTQMITKFLEAQGS